MTYSTAWDQRYTEGTHRSLWPWSDLVRLVEKYNTPGTVLELGAGMGANIPFFHARGYDYHAVEGSSTAVADMRSAFPDYAHKIVQGDFTLGQPWGSGFDLVVDRSAITHNDIDGVRRAVDVVHDALHSEGLYIGVDWWSVRHSDFTGGTTVDGWTNIFRDGPFADVGPVHFSSEEHLMELFDAFEVLHVEHKIRSVLPDGPTVAAFDIVARKR